MNLTAFPAALVPSWAPKGTLAERLLRQSGRESRPASRRPSAAPKGTLAERLLRHFLEGVQRTWTCSTAPKGTLAERLLRRIRTEGFGFLLMVFAPKGTLAERLLRLRVERGQVFLRPGLEVPKGTLAERLLRRGLRAHPAGCPADARPERDLGRKAIETRSSA